MNNFKIFLRKIVLSSMLFEASILFVFPASTNFRLKSFEFGGGGGFMSSSNFKTEAVLGEVGTASMSSSLYTVNAGLTFVQQANTPGAPTLTNDANWYNKLKIVINQSSNPSDTTYAIAISSDDFVTTEYVQNNNTVDTTLGIEDFQTYAQWGGASGEDIIGLTPGTTYKVKVQAREGNYTQSPFGPTATAATSNPTLSFDIDIGGSSDPGETAAPYTLSVGTLSAGSVSTATNRVWIDLDTNAAAGAYVYIYDKYGGLNSTDVNHKIPAVSDDLSSGTVDEGFGIQDEAAGQTSGGPLHKESPYAGSSNTVGMVDTTIRELFSTTAGPITGGRGSFLMKSKASPTTPAAGDYTDTLNLISSASF